MSRTERHKAQQDSAALDQKWLAMAFGMPEANLSSRDAY
jgi:hypothetical protein